MGSTVRSPGFEDDIVLRTDSVTLNDFHHGRLDFAEAVRRGAIEADGPPNLLKALPTWGGAEPLRGRAAGALRGRLVILQNPVQGARR
jgi:hypothetical protein